MFKLAFPWILLALPLPFFVWFLLPQVNLKLPLSLRIPFYNDLLAAIKNTKNNFRPPRPIRLFLVIWSLLIVAAAGPQWVGKPLALSREGRNIMLALDISGSMEINDMVLPGRTLAVSRLFVVKEAAKQFVQARVGDRIGLILFGSRAYLQTPLTYDRDAVLIRLDDATVGLAGQSTSIGDALGLAVKRLQEVAANSRVIILLTDGVNNSGVLSPLKAAELAKLDGIKVYTIGLGSEIDPRSLTSLFFNQNMTADLDEKTLKAIAELTHGRYFRATDPQSLHSIYATINKLETVSQGETTIRPQHEYYPWPLALASLLFFYWLLKKSGLKWHPLLKSVKT